MGLYRVYRTKQEFTDWFHNVIHVTRQQTLDSMILALKETIDPDEETYRKILTAFREALGEVVQLTESDFHDDKEMVYSQHKIDQALKEALGERLFVPFEKRY